MCPRGQVSACKFPTAARRSKRCTPYSSGERGGMLTASSILPASPAGLAADQLLAPWGPCPPDRRRRHVGVLPPRPLPQRRRVRLPRWHLPDTGQQRTHRGPPPQPRRRSRPQPRHPHHRHGQNARLPRYPGLHRPPHRRRQTIREIKRCLKRCDRSGHPLRGRAHGRCSAGPGADLGGRSRTGGSAYDDARCWLAPPVLLRRRGGPPYQSRHRTVASSRRLPLVVRMTAAPRA